MIELIYNEEEKGTTDEENLQEPKNVKQIGEPKDYKRIYIEDYVHTYLLQYSDKKDARAQIAILLGENKKSGGKRQLYIQSALPVENVMEKQGKYLFTEKIWGDIYQECEQYFPKQEILGWFLSRPGISIDKTEVTEETHRTYFSGADKLLFIMEPQEQERAFYAFDGNRFVKQPGYFIYYEKNEPMREFLLKRSEGEDMGRKHEKPDMAVANFRKILEEKQQKNVKKKTQVLASGAKAVAVLLFCLGALIIRNQSDKIKGMEQQINHASQSLEAQETSGDDVLIEEVSGNVEKEGISAEETAEELPVTEIAEYETEEVQSSAPSEEVKAEVQPIIEEVKAEEAETPAEPEVIPQEPEEEAASVPYEEYIVQSGDTLAKISRERYGTDEMVDEICNLNEIADGDYIQEGEIILLP